MRMLIPHAILGGAMLALTYSPSQAQTYAMTSPILITTTTQSNAMGYANNRKFSIDGNGYAYFAVRTHDAAGKYENILYSSKIPWTSVTTASDFASAWLSSGTGVNVGNSPQRVAGISNRSDGYVHMVWYGSEAAVSSSAYSDQIHYAKFDATVPSTLSVASESTPLTVSGFGSAYSSPYSTSDLWQEHPAIAEDSSKNLYVVWESRSWNGTKSVVGVAMNTLNYATGTWAHTGTVSTPPYLSLTSGASQSRPAILAASPTLQYVFCYAQVGGQEQIQYGVVNSGVFSGWSTVAANSAADQRHYSVAIDPNGGVHVVWREGTSAGTLLKYRRGVPNGSGGLTWDATMTVSAATMTDPSSGATVAAFAGTPSVSASSTLVRIAWTQWWNGFVNSNGDTNNGITSSDMGDNDIVEGYGMFSYKANGSGTWTAPQQLMSGISAYPSLSTGTNNGIVLVNYPTAGCGSGCAYGLYFGSVH